MMVPDLVYCNEPSDVEKCLPASSSNNPKSNKAVCKASSFAEAGDRYRVDHRALLFGSKFGKRMEMNSKGREMAAMYAAQEQDLIEEQNEKALEALEGKVTQIREVSLEITKETRHSTEVVDSLSGAFDSASKMLARTRSSLKEVAKQSSGYPFFCTVLFVVVMLVALYVFCTLRRQGHRGFLDHA